MQSCCLTYSTCCYFDIPVAVVIMASLISLNDKHVRISSRDSKVRAHLYTCQLFVRYKREIFIQRVLGFLKTIRSFPKIPEKVRSLPKKSEDFQRRPKSAEGEVIESQSQDAYKRELAPSAFHFKNQGSRGRYCHLFILHMVFVPYMGLS